MAQTAVELNVKLNRMQQSEEATVKAEAEKLSSLVNDLQPSLYSQNQRTVSVTEVNPLKLYTDIASLDLLRKNDPLFSGVQIICIKIQQPGELQMQINLLALNGFTSLQYIHLLFTFSICEGSSDKNKCESDKINNMLQGNTIATILYSVSEAE